MQFMNKKKLYLFHNADFLSLETIIRNDQYFQFYISLKDEHLKTLNFSVP